MECHRLTKLIYFGSGEGICICTETTTKSKGQARGRVASFFCLSLSPSHHHIHLTQLNAVTVSHWLLDIVSFKSLHYHCDWSATVRASLSCYHSLIVHFPCGPLCGNWGRKWSQWDHHHGNSLSCTKRKGSYTLPMWLVGWERRANSRSYGIMVLSGKYLCFYLWVSFPKWRLMV